MLNLNIINSINDIDNMPMSEDVMREIINAPSELTLNDRGELVCSTKEGIIVLDPAVNKIDDVIERIPECPFDIECGGRRSMQQEAVAIYKVILVNSLTKGMFGDDIKNIVEEYNFELLKDSKGGMPFFSLLQSIIEDKNSAIEFILTAANIKLTESKEKKDVSYTGIVDIKKFKFFDKILYFNL